LDDRERCHDEASAIADLRGGNTGALSALIALYQSDALRIAYGITSDRHMAEDVVADAFVRVLQHIRRFDQTRPFGPWFHRIVVNRALDAIAESDHRGQGQAAAMHVLDRADPLPLPETLAIRKEMAETVWAAVEALSPSQRAAVVLRYYLDLDERAIAGTLGCPVGTVKWRLFAARRRLRKSLRGFQDADVRVCVKEESPDAIP